MVASVLKKQLRNRNRLGCNFFAEFVATQINNFYVDEFLTDSVGDMAIIEHEIISTGSIKSFGLEYLEESDN